MIPQNVLSTTPVPSPYVWGEVVAYDPLVDTEMGGVALRDASQGLLVQLWTCWLDGDTVMLSAPSVAPTPQFSRFGITEVSLSFDRNMNPAIAFYQDGQSWLWWFDTLSQSQVFTQLPNGSRNPRVTHDDKRELESQSSDVILAYLRSNRLYFRMQRDRYLIERQLYNGITGQLEKIAMTKGMRLQFQVGNPP